MASRSKSRMSSKNRQSSKTRSQRGGNQGAYPDSAWGYQMNNLGNGWTQFMNSLSLQPGETLATSSSNDIVPIRNLNAQTKMSGGRKRGNKKMRRMQQMQQMQQAQQMQQMQKAQQAQQMQKTKSRSRGKKGGYWGAVLEQAAVPLALLGMQQYYGKRHTRKNGFHKNKSMKRSR
jgi:hypothetical protein